EMVSKDHITLVPNTNYWGTQPTATKIINYEISDDNQAYAKYLNGELDEVNVPLARTQPLKNDPVLSKQIKFVPQLTLFWMDFNTRKAPFNNKDARLAFSKAVDRNALATADVRQVARARRTAPRRPAGTGGAGRLLHSEGDERLPA